MTLLLNLCVWLCQNPRVVRLWLATRALLRALVDCLVDMDTVRPRVLPLDAAPLVERYLQLAEACLTRLIWLRAMEIADQRATPIASGFAYIPPRRLRDADAFATHALSLLDRFARLDYLARRLAARLSQLTEQAANASAHQHIVADYSGILSILILRTRTAHGLGESTRAPTRRSATLIPQTGPPLHSVTTAIPSHAPQSTDSGGACARRFTSA